MMVIPAPLERLDMPDETEQRVRLVRAVPMEPRAILE